MAFGLLGPVVGTWLSQLGHSGDPGGWWPVPKLRCGLLLMGPSGCGAVEVGVPVPMAPLGWAPVLPSQTFWSQSAVFPSVWHLASFSRAYLAVSACGVNVS